MSIEKAYNTLLMKHSLSTENRRHPEGANYVQEAALPSCGDEVTLFLRVEDSRLVDAGFDGYGCAVSQASASVMLDVVRGKTFDEANDLITSFLAMLEGSGDENPALGDALLLKEAVTLPGRAACAAMAWETLRKALDTYR